MFGTRLDWQLDSVGPIRSLPSEYLKQLQYSLSTGLVDIMRKRDGGVIFFFLFFCISRLPVLQCTTMQVLSLVLPMTLNAHPAPTIEGDGRRCGARPNGLAGGDPPFLHFNSCLGLSLVSFLKVMGGGSSFASLLVSQIFRQAPPPQARMQAPPPQARTCLPLPCQHAPTWRPLAAAGT